MIDKPSLHLGQMRIYSTQTCVKCSYHPAIYRQEKIQTLKIWVFIYRPGQTVHDGLKSGSLTPKSNPNSFYDCYQCIKQKIPSSWCPKSIYSEKFHMPDIEFQFLKTWNYSTLHYLVKRHTNSYAIIIMSPKKKQGKKAKTEVKFCCPEGFVYTLCPSCFPYMFSTALMFHTLFMLDQLDAFKVISWNKRPYQVH